MAISAQDLFKYGFANDPRELYQTESTKLKADYDERIADWRARLEQGRQRGASENFFNMLDRQYETIQQQRDRAFERLDQRVQRQEEILETRLSSPSIQRRVLERKTQEMQAQAAEAAEKRRQESEVMQRESAERQASRFRARGSARAGARPMLSAARMAPQQTMAPEQTLGAFMPK